MVTKIGCDIVQISNFSTKINNTSQVLQKIFTVQELKNSHTDESLAGKLAAKEATIKALNLQPGCWQRIEIIKLSDGKPQLVLNFPDLKINNCDVSISHDGNYAMAMVIINTD